MFIHTFFAFVFWLRHVKSWHCVSANMCGAGMVQMWVMSNGEGAWFHQTCAVRIWSRCGSCQMVKEGSIIKHVLCRYGPDVGEAANDLSHATIEGGMAYFTITRMGVRSVAKRIAKRTAKGLVKNAVGMRSGQQSNAATAQQVSAGRN